jgi:hypothetical protein
MPLNPIVVPLRSHSHRRSLSVQKLQHVAPAFALLVQGLSTFGDNPGGVRLLLASAEIITSGLLLGAVARAIRGARAHRPESAPHVHGIDWVDIFTAAMLSAEALERWYSEHHIARPTIFTAVGMLVLGLFHGRIFSARDRRRVLRADEAGLYIGGKPFRSWRAGWNEIAGVDIGERWAIVRTSSGRERRLDLSDLEEAPAVRRALEIARDRIGPPAVATDSV